MARRLLSLIINFCMCCQCVLSFASTDENQATKAVQNALVYPAQQQNTDGSWGQGPNDKVKATAEVYNALLLLKIFTTEATRDWLKNAQAQDAEDKARLAYANRFNGSASAGFDWVLLSYSDKIDNSVEKSGRRFNRWDGVLGAIE